MRAKIFIKNLILDAKVGIYPHENAPQKIKICAKISYDAPDPECDFLDYDFLLQQIRKTTESAHFPLIEHLCQKIICEIFEIKSVKKIRVKISKLGIFDDCEVAVSMKKSRETERK